MKASFFSLFLTALCVTLQAQIMVENLTNLSYARMAHQQIAIGQDKFIVVGGHVNGFNLTKNAEIYNSNTKTWQVSAANYNHDMGFIAKLNNGKYLIGGGCSSSLGVGQSATTEIFDPSDNSFTPAASMNVVRTNACAATLKDGRVLVIGNWYASAANGEVYDPVTNKYTLTGPCLVARSFPVIIPTDDGGAIVCGGPGTRGEKPSAYIFEKYDPVTNNFTELTRTLFDGETSWDISMYVPYMSHQLLLPNGKYAVVVYDVAATKVRLISVDPATNKIEEIKTNKPIPLDDETAPTLKYGCSRIPMIDKTRNLLHIIQHGGTTSNIILRIVTINLKTGELTTSKKEGFDYYVASSCLSMLPDGRILFTGGQKFDNFSLSNKAFIVTPEFPQSYEKVCNEPFVYHNYFDLNGTSGFNSLKKHPSGGYGAIAYRTTSTLKRVELVRFDDNGKFISTKTIRTFPLTSGIDFGIAASDIDGEGGWYVLTNTYNPGTQWNEVLHVNSAGDSLWNIVVSEKGEWSRTVYTSVKSSTDGGCIISGSTNWFPTHPRIKKISKTGTVKWTSTDFPTTDLGYSIANSTSTNPNGEIFVTGKVHHNLNGKQNMFVSKLDSIGNKIWSKEYNSGFTNSGDSIFGWGNAITYTADGGCIVGGFISDKGRGDGKGGAILKKLDAAGNTLWEHKYFTDGYYPAVLNLIKLNENDKYLAYIHQNLGSTSPRATVLKFSDAGDSLWIQQGYDYRVSLSDIDQNDNLLFVASSPLSETNWENQALLYRTTSDGILHTPQLWAAPYDNEKNVSLTPTIAWSTNPHFGTYTLQIATDSLFSSIAYEGTGILLTDYQFTYHKLTSPLNPMTKYFSRVQQVGVQGCTSAWSDIRRFTTLDNTAVKNNFDDIFKIYPNPAKSVLTIEFSQIPEMNSTIEITDITGKTVYSAKIQNFNNLNGNILNINLAELSDGFYSCKITNEKTNVVKMLVVKK